MPNLQPTIIGLLALLCGGVLWVGIQIWQLNRDLAPLLQSSFATGIANL